MDYKKIVETALAEVGKQFTTYTSPYTAFLDSINWYCAKKQGATTWCCIINDWEIAVNAGDLTYEQARQIVCEPVNNKVNYGAGVKEKAQYYKSAGRWYDHKAKNCPAQVGDEIFFYKSGTKELGHVGRVVDWDNTYIYTVEGSTTYEGKPHSVGKKQYKYNNARIAGYGRPDWYRFDKAEKPVDEKPTTEPEKPADPVTPATPVKSIDDIAKEVIAGKWGNGKERGEKLAAAGYDYYAVQARVNELLGTGGGASGKTYTVCVNSYLNVRNSPNGTIIGSLQDGEKVTVYETKNGWGRIGNGRWVFMSYLK